MNIVEMESGREIEDFCMDTFLIRVYPVADRWHVTQIERNNQQTRALTDFEIKNDALSYALAVAEARPGAVVEVYGPDGALEARSAYWIDRNSSSRLGRR